jgi:hypothetical protein
MQFTLQSATANAAAPYCIGFAFRQGDIPAGNGVAADSGVIQVTPKNTWPDGSLKFAVLAGLANLLPNVPLLISLAATGSPASGSALTTANLKATGITAQIGCGSFGTVTWQGADWDTPFQAWIAGPQMSSWIYRKAVASDTHLVGWLEVRLWANGAVEVLPWIENGYIRVAAPTNKSATYTFSLGSTSLVSVAINLLHHTRTPLISGSALSYWLGSDPAVTPRHDTVYLQSTELVPAYGAHVSSSADIVTALVGSYAPLQAGNFNYDGDNMPGTGYQDPIGLLPQHDVLYLVSDSSNAYGAVVRNGFSAGRWAIHYRDENTLRPLRFSQYPSLNIDNNQGFKDTGGSSSNTYTPAPTGGNPPVWDVAHSPSVGYLAYLITGRWYFMEEVQFATTCNYLGNGDNNVLRNGSQGLVQPAADAWQTRSCAWDWRARFQALTVTPDNDIALRNEFIVSVQANIDHFYNRYVGQPNNPFGFIQTGTSAYDGTTSLIPPWQQDFVTAAFGYALASKLPISAVHQTKLANFFAWTAKSAVGRLSAAGTGFPYMDADVYALQISSAPVPDYAGGTGPWFSTWDLVWAAQTAALARASATSSWLSTTDGVLCGEIMPGERALWGNLMPAISYAVRHGVAGALTAYNRIVNASNWSTLRDAFSARPVWAVRPVQVQPNWLAGHAINEWVAIPNTAGAGGSAVDAYSGFAYNDLTDEIIIALAGGHTNSSDNRVVSLRLTDDAPTWQQRSAQTANVTQDVAYYSDGKPASRHVYSTCHFVPQLNRLMTFGVRFAYGAAFTFSKVDGFSLDTNLWDRAGTWPDAPSGHYGAVMIRATGDVWTSALSRWSPSSNTWSQPIATRTSDYVRWPIAHDLRRNQLFTLNWGDGEGGGSAALSASRVPLGRSAQISVTFHSSSALDSFAAEAPSYAAMDYDIANDRFLFYSGQGNAAGRIYVITPNDTNVWDMSLLTLGAASALPPATPGSGVQNRFRYAPALRGFVLLPFAGSNLYFIRTST